jgi:glutamine synthetase
MIEGRAGYLSMKERIADMYSQEQMLNTIKEKSVEFIRLQFSNIQGRGKNVTIPVTQLGKALKNGISFDGSPYRRIC